MSYRIHPGGSLTGPENRHISSAEMSMSSAYKDRPPFCPVVGRWPAQQASALENGYPVHFGYHSALSALSPAVAAHVQPLCESDPSARLLAPVGGHPFILSCYSLAIFALGLHLPAGWRASSRPSSFKSFHIKDWRIKESPLL